MNHKIYRNWIPQWTAMVWTLVETLVAFSLKQFAKDTRSAIEAVTTREGRNRSCGHNASSRMPMALLGHERRDSAVSAIVDDNSLPL